MRPDVKIRDYYYNFISTAKRDIIEYQKELSYYNKVKEKQLELINASKTDYINLFKIYIEDENIAIKRAELLIKTEVDPIKRFLLSHITKYAHICSKIKEYTNMIVLATKRKDIKFRDYETYIFNYYNKVHKFVLQGFGYKYTNGIGVLCICRWKRKEHRNKYIDYNETNKRKKELLAAGKKLYNKNEAAWYAARGIPYDGVDYRVYKHDSHIYIIDIVKSKLFTNRNHIFERTEYVNTKLKGIGYKGLADMCKDLDEISVLPVDLRCKLNMLLYKDPSNYIRYIRNDEQDYYKHGAHNSKD